MERVVKGIWVPIEIWEATDISWNEKLLLMEIDSYSSAKIPCFMSNEFIADMLKVSTRTASTYIGNLVDKGYVRVVGSNGRQRYIESCYCFQAEWKQTSKQSGKTVPHIYNNNISITSPKGEDNSKPASRFNFYKSLLAAGVSEDVARTWMDVRKTKRATNSELAFQKVMREIERSGRSADECIRIAAENSWCGFEADWLLKNEHKLAPEKPKSRSIMENNLAVLAELSGLTPKTNVDEQ